MASALDGITVLDITHGPAGALATMFLCDNGADVLRLEVPGFNDIRDGPCYLVWDRGKGRGRLEPDADTHVFSELVRRADVLVESFPPSSDYQRVVDYATLARINPRLVHCSITAYGKEGSLKDEPALDDLVMARMGVLSSQPGFRPGPVHVMHPIPSVGAALLAGQGVVASLFARERTGMGRKVETSLMAGTLLYAPKLVGDKLGPRPFQSIPAGGGPFYSVFECADNNYVQLGCIHGGFVDLAAAVMGIADVMTDPKYGDGRRPANEEARAELFGIVAGVIKTRPYAEWAEIFEAADVPYGRACVADEAFDHPQVRFNDIVVELEDHEVGLVKQVGLPLKFTETPGRIKGPRAADIMSAEEALGFLGTPASAPATTSTTRAAPQAPPLDGIRVLEMTNVIAGPTAGKLLGDLGAEVIKMESPDGDISRPAGMTYFLYLNSNKRGVSVNTRTPEGKEIARTLAARADVMLANMRPGATDRMGLGIEDMKDLNPGIVRADVTAFGWEGPWSHRPGVDPLAQAWMGLQRAQGGPHNPPVFLGMMAPTDFTAGAMATLGIVMALYVRERTGLTQKVDTNLLNAGAVLSYDGFLKYDGKPPRRLADKGQYGLDALHRLYETAEGWLYLAASPRDRKALFEAVGRADLATDAGSAPESGADRDDEVSEALAAAFATRPAEEWVDDISRIGIPCAPVTEGYNVRYFDDPHVVTTGGIACGEHPVLGQVRFSHGGLSFGDTSEITTRRTPLLGEHTREALDEVGYTSRQIDDLYSKGVIVTEEPLTGAG